MKDRVSKTRFKALDRQFRSTFDDFYHDYYEKHGSDVDPIKALIRTLASIFLEYSEHLPTTYKPDAISSGTQAHLIAVRKNHHTTDKLGNVAGDEHKKVIKDTPRTSPLSAPITKDKTSKKSKDETSGEKIVCIHTIKNLRTSFLYKVQAPTQLIKPNLLVPI